MRISRFSDDAVRVLMYTVLRAPARVTVEEVAEAAVVPRVDELKGRVPDVYVSLKPGYEGKVRPEDLIEFCRAHLAAYKYPRIIEIVDEVPKTPTGKFLRRVLRERTD